MGDPGWVRFGLGPLKGFKRGSLRIRSFWEAMAKDAGVVGRSQERFGARVWF